MSKYQWLKAYELLEDELGREPTSEEVDEKAIDLESALIDKAKDIRKYGE